MHSQPSLLAKSHLKASVAGGHSISHALDASAAQFLSKGLPPRKMQEQCRRASFWYRSAMSKLSLLFHQGQVPWFSDSFGLHVTSPPNHFLCHLLTSHFGPVSAHPRQESGICLPPPRASPVTTTAEGHLLSCQPSPTSPATGANSKTDGKRHCAAAHGEIISAFSLE